MLRLMRAIPVVQMAERLNHLLIAWHRCCKLLHIAKERRKPPQRNQPGIPAWEATTSLETAIFQPSLFPESVSLRDHGPDGAVVADHLLTVFR